MNLHPGTAYAHHQARQRDLEARARERRALVEARSAAVSDKVRRSPGALLRLAHQGARRGTAVAAATGVLVLTALAASA